MCVTSEHVCVTSVHVQVCMGVPGKEEGNKISLQTRSL